MPALLGELFAPLRTTNNHSQLRISPTELNVISVLLVIALFICRQIKHLVGLGTPFVPFTAEQGSLSTSASSHASPSENVTENDRFALPDLSLSMPLRFNLSHKTTFSNAISQSPAIEIDIGSNCALLALYFGALSEAAMLLLLCKRGCPVRPLGSVKVRHRFEILDVDACRSLFENSGPDATKTLVLLSKFPRSARRVRKGVEVDIEVTMVERPSNAGRRNQSTGDSRSIFRQEMTILQFVKWRGKTRAPLQPLPTPPIGGDNSESLASQTSVSSSARPVEPTWLEKPRPNSEPFTMARLSARSTRSWASFCKDYNPIHVSPLLARLLGLSGVIAHGNHIVAACFWFMAHLVQDSKLGQISDCGEAAVVSRSIGDSMQILKDSHHRSRSQKWAMDLTFKSMLFLPAAFWPRARNGEVDRFEIVNAKNEKVGVDVHIISEV